MTYVYTPDHFIATRALRERNILCARVFVKLFYYKMETLNIYIFAVPNSSDLYTASRSSFENGMQIEFN